MWLNLFAPKQSIDNSECEPANGHLQRTHGELSWGHDGFYHEDAVSKAAGGRAAAHLLLFCIVHCCVFSFSLLRRGKYIFFF